MHGWPAHVRYEAFSVACGGLALSRVHVKIGISGHRRRDGATARYSHRRGPKLAGLGALVHPGRATGACMELAPIAVPPAPGGALRFVRHHHGWLPAGGAGQATLMDRRKTN
ncbi:Uncharacterised protein [Legionella pneumophila]|nr:Uncharacterised protein [Legionella pneumophila]CZG31720.1 Uncharacterised protein [Legionella pneumophila]CZG45062.1 Uncharacterised protein [Legionella pneumophila]